MTRNFVVACITLLVWSRGVLGVDVALIAGASGDVKMSRPTKVGWRPATAMQGLPAGSKLQVGAGGQATVVLMNTGARYLLGGGSVAVITAAGCQGVSGPAPKALASLAVRHQKIFRGSLVAGGRPASIIVRGAKEFVLLTLKNTSTLEARPVFKWQALPDATSYKVSIWNEENKRVWQTEVTVPTVSYPADAPALTPGVDYVWRVTTTVQDKPYEKEGSFRILTAAKQKAVTDELDALKDMDDPVMASLLRAEVLSQNDLLDDAIASYTALALKYPESAAAHTALADLLAGQDRSEESKAQQEAAQRLSG